MQKIILRHWRTQYKSQTYNTLTINKFRQVIKVKHYCLEISMPKLACLVFVYPVCANQSLEPIVDFQQVFGQQSFTMLDKFFLRSV